MSLNTAFVNKLADVKKMGCHRQKKGKNRDNVQFYRKHWVSKFSKVNIKSYLLFCALFWIFRVNMICFAARAAIGVGNIYPQDIVRAQCAPYLSENLLYY